MNSFLPSIRVCGRFASRLLLACCAVVSLAGSLFAQSTFGTLLGTVHDGSGAVVAGAQLTLLNAGTNAALLGFSLAAAAIGWRPAASVSAVDAVPVSGPFSPAELKQFRALAPVDVHTHIFTADPSFLAMLQKFDLHILDILVVDDMEPGHSDLEKQKREAWNVVHASHGYASLCTSFDPYVFDQPDYATNAIRILNEDFARGAIAVKLWKSVGMEIKDQSGHYLMPDSPVF